jgi:hypothetical protein
MRQLKIALIGITLAALSALGGCATAPPAPLTLPQFQAALERGDVTDVHILYRPYYLEHITRVSPAQMEYQAAYRCDFILAEPRRTELTSALKELTVGKAADLRDLYWSATFWDAQGHLLFWTYLDRSYPQIDRVIGSINGKPVEMNYSLLNWLESDFDEQHMSPDDCWARMGFVPMLERFNQPSTPPTQ